MSPTFHLFSLGVFGFIMVKELLKLIVSKFGWHPFYNECLAFFLNLVGFGKTHLYVFA